MSNIYVQDKHVKHLTTLAYTLSFGVGDFGGVTEEDGFAVWEDGAGADHAFAFGCYNKINYYHQKTKTNGVCYFQLTTLADLLVGGSLYQFSPKNGPIPVYYHPPL